MKKIQNTQHEVTKEKTKQAQNTKTKGIANNQNQTKSHEGMGRTTDNKNQGRQGKGINTDNHDQTK